MEQAPQAGPSELPLIEKPIRDPKVFGHIPGINIGKTWQKRQECSADGVHPGIMSGIYGSKDEGTYSIALSGGYEDDVDCGDTFTYTGSGGRDLTGGLFGEKKRRVGPQAYDQTFDHPPNMALKVSCMTQKPVRVVRGYKLDSVFAPAEGYRYDGLYRVERYWQEKGKAGFLVCRYAFRRLEGQPPIPLLEYGLHLNYKRKTKRRKLNTKKPKPSDGKARSDPPALAFVPWKPATEVKAEPSGSFVHPQGNITHGEKRKREAISESSRRSIPLPRRTTTHFPPPMIASSLEMVPITEVKSEPVPVHLPQPAVLRHSSCTPSSESFREVAIMPASPKLLGTSSEGPHKEIKVEDTNAYDSDEELYL